MIADTISTEQVTNKPVILITGASGNIGSALRHHLDEHYCVIGCDRTEGDELLTFDITSPASIQKALEEVRSKVGHRLAAVIHLAAYFDFSGEASDRYTAINIEGTQHLLDALASFEVEQFIYASTMLVHKAGTPGELIDENSPIDPAWAYPKSKREAEQVIQSHPSNIPYTLLRLAGLYDDETAVPTLAHQIARVYERDMKSMAYAGDKHAGQSLIHLDDLISLFDAVIRQRKQLDHHNIFVAGETQAVSYAQLQQAIGQLTHGEKDWPTLTVPEPIAKVGAWLEDRAEPVIPDELDEGQRPFIKPFMIDLASDHYELNIDKAEKQLAWHPRHRILAKLPTIIENLKKSPEKWYEKNHIKAPAWIESAKEQHLNAGTLRSQYEDNYQQIHKQNLWAPFACIFLGCWLLCSPSTLAYQSQGMTYSDWGCGLFVMLLGAMAISAKPIFQMSRYGLALISLWLMFAPLIFWAPTASAYANGTIMGGLIFALALCVRPFPFLMSPVAATSGPTIPPGWQFNPSDWFQRMPIIVLAVIGFFISRYMTAYQLGHIDSVWDPFFYGIPGNGKNGTEEIITSDVSKAWPVPDAGIGALTYLLEILTGLIGSRQRWRTMPWLVLLFGFMIIPLGAISITFIIIQPIIIGTWCTLCLIAASAMLLQIPYSFDEIVATIAFLRRRAKAGHPWIRILFTGDTDDESQADKNLTTEDFNQSPTRLFKEMALGGVSLSLPLWLCLGIGVWLMCTRLTLDTEGLLANTDHVIGALVLTVTITAAAEVTRSFRLLNVFLGIALLVMPFIFDSTGFQKIAGVLCALILIACSIPRGKIHHTYGAWSAYIK